MHEVSVPIAFDFHFDPIAIINNLVNLKVCVRVINAFFIWIYEFCCPNELVGFLRIFKFKRIHWVVLILADCFIVEGTFDDNICSIGRTNFKSFCSEFAESHCR